VPFLSAQEIVKAARDSTEQYLNFLTENNRGIEKYTVDQLIETPQLLLIEGKTQYQYLCRLPSHLSIRSDSSAVYTPIEDPARLIPVHIISYERRSGRTQLASKEKIQSQGGSLCLDFRWLVQRCLEWFQERGRQVVDLENLAARTKVEWKKAEKLIFEEPNDLNHPRLEQQREAIQSILCNDLSYIWGPPGTGKTKYVLAKAIYALTNQKQKALVLAYTNLAVDNALESILEFVPKDKVARLGIPSENFLDRYPECCEQRAFEFEIRDLNKRIQDLEVERKALEEIKTLTFELERNRDQLRNCEENIPQKQSLIERISPVVETEARRVEMVEKDLEKAKEILSEMQQERDSLRIPELNNEIESNESLSTETRQTLSEYRHKLDNLGFFTRLLICVGIQTNKVRRLNAKISKAKSDLEQIEATLQSIRQRRDQRLGRFEKLNATICEQTQKVEQAERNLHTAQKELSIQHSTLDAAKSDLLSFKNNIQSLSETIDTDSARLKELTLHFQPFDKIPLDGRKAAIEEEIEKLEQKKKEFELDLSNKSVIGMTLDGFIGFSMNTSLTVDRVFVDEAPYAPVAKILPLLSLKRPIALLGDDKQLPPICEDVHDAVMESYWAKGAHFLKDVFRHGNDFEEIHSLSEAYWPTDKKILTVSYRFGERLARILDAHVYDIGLQGWGEMDTELSVCDCEPLLVPNSKKWQNHSEANKIVSHIRRFTEIYPNEEERPSAVVLTPYKNQAKLIWQKLRDEHLLDAVEVLNTHKAQGREWDWVFFSVSDTTRLPGVRPFLTDSNIPVGKLVLNTTISRAKKRLILFLDKTYWSKRKCLIGDIIHVAGEQ